jgi:hypothetical protein
MGQGGTVRVGRGRDGEGGNPLGSNLAPTGLSWRADEDRDEQRGGSTPRIATRHCSSAHLRGAAFPCLPSPHSGPATPYVYFTPRYALFYKYTSPAAGTFHLLVYVHVALLLFLRSVTALSRPAPPHPTPALSLSLSLSLPPRPSLTPAPLYPTPPP